MSTHANDRQRRGFLPPYLVERLDPSTLTLDQQLRARREAAPGVREALPGATAPADGGWTVHDAHQGTDLPGTPVRSTGEPESGDVAVDEAYRGVEAALALFREVFGRASYDGADAHVTATVHYGRDYDNAFWDGTQLVFGDGDGKVFDRFTKPVDVLAHELSHAVTERTAGLVYQGQSGALNESMSDVFGSMVKQRLLGQDAASADWLIGEGLFLPGVNGVALRSMKAPGTAYDDPQLGKDPQPDSMAGYVETTDDNGGVHLNSGIPNRAFQLAATAIGGSSWETPGKIWYTTLTSGIASDIDFAGFAEATLTAAQQVAPDAVEAVRGAWETVGVLGAAPAPAPSGGTPSSGTALTVRRSGGFAGRTVEQTVVLGDDPRTPEIEQLLGGIDLAGLRTGDPMPDMFVYSFQVGDQQAQVPEQRLTPELQQLARIVLDDGM